MTLEIEVFKGEVARYISRIDGAQRPYAVCASGPADAPRPMIVEVSPGGDDLEQGVRTTERIAKLAARCGEPCVVVRPTGRGPGSVYQNYGEEDAIEAIEDAVRRYQVDRRRICVTGVSMGGAATWYLTAHHPDLFAAGAPFCGYCDYRLWEKPGGPTFHMHAWEEPSWKARSAAFLAENFGHTPVWMVHGEWDRAVGGGVPREHSRQMERLLRERGADCRYTELPKTGHDCKKKETFVEVVRWMLRQRKAADPDHVALATFELRHNRSYWVTIEQIATYGERALVDARRAGGGSLAARTENVRAFSLGPCAGGGQGDVVIDGQRVGAVTLSQRATFLRGARGDWGPVDGLPPAGKRHGCSGPIGDLFHDDVVLVAGTTGTDEETFFLDNLAIDAGNHYRTFNGGVHRGGIRGENHVDLKRCKDVELTAETRRNSNLLLYGNPRTNAILALYADRLPLRFEDGSIRVCGKTFRGKAAAVFAVFPHPENPARCVAVHGGLTPDAIAWGSHLHLHLLPDYIAYDGGQLLGWGFWDSDWKPQPALSCGSISTRLAREVTCKP